MANNITTVSPRAVLATDQIGDIHYPISKLAHGNEDSAELVSTDSPLPVQGDGVADGAVVNLDADDPTTCRGYGSVILSITGISGTVTVSGSVNGTDYFSLTGVNLTDLSSAASITANGVYAYPALASIRYSGTATVSALLKRN